MVLGVGAKKPEFYEGETKYHQVFNFLNVYSETFFRVGEDKTRPGESTKADKPWLSEKLPEMTLETGNDVCFKIDGIICVVLANKEKPSVELVNTMAEIQNYLTPKIDRGGIKYRFAWISTTTQAKMVQILGLEVGSGPKVV